MYLLHGDNINTMLIQIFYNVDLAALSTTVPYYTWRRQATMMHMPISMKPSYLAQTGHHDAHAHKHEALIPGADRPP